MRWRDHLPGLAIALGYVLVLVRTARNLGFSRDEGFYFHASSEYARWFDLLYHDRHAAVTRAAVDAAWGANHEHPALMKSLFGLSWLLLHEKWHWVARESLCFRLPGMLLAGLGLYLTYLFGARAYGRGAGVLAALLLGFMPRVFYHAHLDCFDVPVLTMWLLVVWCYWRSLDGGALWGVATGVTWGLALETKHNAWFLPVVVVLHFALTRGRDTRPGAPRGSLPIPTALVWMGLLGPPIFFGLWPWMWFDTFSTPTHQPGRLSEYVGFHLNHAYYNMEFLGVNYFRPPFPRGYLWAMVLFTVPTVTLVLFVLGLVSRAPSMARSLAWVLTLIPFGGRLGWVRRALSWAERGRDPRGTDLLLLLACAVPTGPWLSAKTPIFGGTKHWFPAYGPLAVFAGAGFLWAARQLAEALGPRVRAPWLVPAALGSLVVLPPVWQTAHSHPFGLSNYVPLVGGAPGAATLGLNRQFWGFTTGSLVPWFNANAPPNAAVFVHDTAWESWTMLQRDRWLRQDLRGEWQPAASDYSMVHHELHMNEVDYQLWTAYQSASTVHVLTYDGVPIVSVYARPRRQEP
ncbi:MAG: glycosyltransferase family 39 protein [Deltaproteobacteria bacterium]|nr:glycosyltransferase family 39 protein [Deltaproteobacteria bacterium]